MISKKSIYAWIALIVLLVGCGANSKQRTLKTTLVTINTVRDGFSAWDDSNQTEIVNNASSADEANGQLAEYRRKRESVLVGFALAYEALATASLDLTEANFLLAIKQAQVLYKLIINLTGKDFIRAGK